MNWGEFKKTVESAGVTDSTDLRYVDVTTDLSADADDMTVEILPTGEAEIYL